MSRIIPTPAVCEKIEGVFKLNGKLNIFLQNKNNQNKISKLFEEVFLNFDLKISFVENENYANLIIKDALVHKDKDFYKIDINIENIIINSASYNSLVYSISSLFQALCPKKMELNCYLIEDYPRYKYRGAHLDVSRHFFSKEEVKKYIKHLFTYKINYFHFHLVDDQGFRIQIDKYPLLTSKGAYRTQKDGSRYGGFYTKEDIKEIIDYADIFGIEIIPEIEMPGHAQAAIAAYPFLSCKKDEQLEVWNNWGISENAYCVGDEKVIDFLHDVLAEVSSLFPCRYFHIGADECLKNHWKECSKCQNLIKEKNLKDEFELQAYFVNEIGKYLKTKDKILMGWDEILEGKGLNEGVAMYWRDGHDEGAGLYDKDKNLAIDCLDRKMGLIICPTKHFYFNFSQTLSEHERFGIPKDWHTPFEKVLKFDPKDYIGEDRICDKNFLGIQFNLWTERIENFDILEHMLFPRISAFAQLSWSRNFSEDFFLKKYELHKSFLKNCLKVNFDN